MADKPWGIFISILPAEDGLAGRQVDEISLVLIGFKKEQVFLPCSFSIYENRVFENVRVIFIPISDLIFGRLLYLKSNRAHMSKLTKINNRCCKATYDMVKLQISYIYQNKNEK